MDDNQNKESMNNQTSTYNVPPKKRSRSNPVQSAGTGINSDADFRPCAMDTTQINSLANIFSQSFPEFTPTEPTHEPSSAFEMSTEYNTFALCRDSIALTA